MMPVHTDNCEICRDGIDVLPPEYWVYGVQDKITRIYTHVLAKDSFDAIKKLGLTINNVWVTVLTRDRVKELKIKGKGVKKMKTELEASLARLQSLAAFGQAVLDLAKNIDGASVAKKKRKRRTKAEIEAAKAAEPPEATKPKRKHSKKPPVAPEAVAAA